MLGSLIEGFMGILLRVWTIGVFYFLNNRLFSWMKDSRTPKIPYQKITQLQKKENNCQDNTGFELCSRHNSWKNFIFMNLRDSKNQECPWGQTTMSSLYQKDSSSCINNYKKDFSVLELFSSWSKQRLPQLEKLAKTSYKEPTMYCESHSMELLPCCDSEKLEFIEACPYGSSYFSGIYQNEQNKFKEMEELKKEMYCLYQPGKNCSRAESVDSGFQSFHNIDMKYTCVNTDGVILYISGVCYNKEGRVIAMTVGFGVEDNSSEESFFSGEEDDGDELSSDEKDSVCSDSEEDFIVFDATECEEPEQFCPNSMDEFSVAVTLTTACPTVELKISQTLSPPSYFPCVPQHENHSKSFRFKKERKFNLYKDIDAKSTYEKGTKIQQTELQPVECSAGIADSHRKKVHFSEDIEVHKIITWDFAYRHARIGPWKDLATDRVHFQRKIDEIACVLEPVLKKKIAIMNR